MEPNDSNRLEQAEETRKRFFDWIFLPLPVVLALIGIGILSGLLFANNPMLEGSLRIIIGAALTVYGSIRIFLIIRRLRAPKKANLWIKKS